MEKVVSNSTCLISLERIGHLELLRSCFEEIYIPPGVEEEIGVDLDWLTIKPVGNRDLVLSLQTQVGKGEAEAIALAMQLNVPVLLDDRKARSLAESLKVPVKGTLGLLLYAKAQGIISEVKPILIKLQQANFYLSSGLWYEILKQAGET